MITTASTFSISGAATVNTSKTYFSKNADSNGNDVVININAKYRKIINLLDSKIRFQEQAKDLDADFNLFIRITSVYFKEVID